MDPSELRTSDRERMQVAELLQAAMAEGFVDTDEFDERTRGAFSAKTRGDLAALTADLPPRMRFDVGYDLEPPAPTSGSPAGKQVVMEHSLETVKQGDGWQPPQRIALRSWAGTAILDFATAELIFPRYEIELDAKGSTIKLYLPVGAGVELDASVSGLGSISDKRPDKSRDPRMPVFAVTGKLPFSTVKILGPKRGWWDV